MNLDDLLFCYFGTCSIDDLSPEVRSAGVERMQVDLGLSKDSGHRFGLWSILHLLDAAPDLDVAFDDEADREAARNFMDLLAKADERTER